MSRMKIMQGVCTNSFPTSPRGDRTQLMIEIEPKLKYRELQSSPSNGVCGSMCLAPGLVKKTMGLSRLI